MVSKMVNNNDNIIQYNTNIHDTEVAVFVGFPFWAMSKSVDFGLPTELTSDFARDSTDDTPGMQKMMQEVPLFFSSFRML